MEQFKQFDLEKQVVIDTLDKLREIVMELDKFGVDSQRDLEKIENAMASVQFDVLRIALLGAFSDGKTSVIAAWLGKIMDDMKIDVDESSDRIAIYKPEGLPGQCEIVDTPGLFGDKERTIGGQQVVYEDITKRYISEAHLILYVVDATNPLKESHSAIVKWILRDLNKLSSTVFVINKMDEVTDLTEESLFAEQAAIKKDNLKAKLQRAANLTPQELERLNIVCIAANPNGRGLEFWFGKPEVYESRSHINDLKALTSRILKDSVPEVLIAKTGLDVIRDVASQKLAEVHLLLNELKSYEEHNREEFSRIQVDIDRGRAEVKRLAGELFRELDTMERQLLAKLRPLSLDDIQVFLEEEIGYKVISEKTTGQEKEKYENVGYKLELRIKGAVDRFFQQSCALTQQISDDILRQLNSSESFLEAMSQKTLGSIASALTGISNLNPSVIKESIFFCRNVLKQLGFVYKFKPWEATKLAGNISKWAGPIGAVISLGTDAYQIYKKHESEQKLKEFKDSISEMIKDSFKAIYDLLKEDEKMLEAFAPELKKLEEIVQKMREEAKQIRSSRDQIERIQQRLNSLALPSLSPARPGLSQ